MHHRRRVHRPHDAGPPLVATACTRRSRPRKASKIEEENQTLATITFQNYFRIYKKLAGHDRHRRHRGRGVPQDLQARRHASIPTNRPMVRKDLDDVVYKTEREKFTRGRATRSRSCHEKGQPVLVGTVSRREVRGASRRSCKKKGIPHDVLNAKQHEREADDRRAGGPQGRGHHLHQHGRPRHRHHPRRQPRVHGARRGRARGATPASRGTRPTPEQRGGRTRRRYEALQGTSATPEKRGGAGGAAACTSSAPSATSRAASTTSCAAAPAARATRAARASSCRSKTT